MSRKDYKRGAADAMEAYSGFGEKQERAIRHVEKQIEKTADNIDRLGDQIGEISDYISDKEKAQLYKLNTPVDIEDLDDAEKRLLLAVLYQLSYDEEEVTEYQQNYLRAVQKYLKIYNPQTEIEYESIENIQDISAQKAVLQAVLEFFYLGTHPKTYSDDQLDVLELFQVNRKTRRDITGHIDAIVAAVGRQGLAEKYGAAAEAPSSEFASYKDNGDIPEKAADLCAREIGRHHYSLFSNAETYDDENRDLQYYIETQNYFVVYCEKDQYTPIEGKYGFCTLDKQTGAVRHIDIDYEKFFPKPFVMFYAYCIYGDTVYFVYNHYFSSEKGSMVAVDFSSGICTSFAYKVPSKGKFRLHLTANESYVMIYSEQVDNGYSSFNGKTHLIDLTQGGRIFEIVPKDLFPIDGFLLDGKICFRGTREKSRSILMLITAAHTSIYQYHPGTQTTTDMFPIPGSCELYPFWDIVPDDSLSKRIVHFEDKYFFFTDKQNAFVLRDPLDTTQRHGKNLFDYWHGKKECRFCGDGVFVRDKGVDKLYYISYKTCEKTLVREHCTNYMLFGDYLYCRDTNNWYKTNISNGFKTLQWELFQMEI